MGQNRDRDLHYVYIVISDSAQLRFFKPLLLPVNYGEARSLDLCYRAKSLRLIPKGLDPITSLDGLRVP